MTPRTLPRPEREFGHLPPGRSFEPEPEGGLSPWAVKILAALVRTMRAHRQRRRSEKALRKAVR